MGGSSTCPECDASLVVGSRIATAFIGALCGTLGFYAIVFFGLAGAAATILVAFTVAGFVAYVLPPRRVGVRNFKLRS